MNEEESGSMAVASTVFLLGGLVVILGGLVLILDGLRLLGVI
jgi:hypothetical protein